MNGDHRGWSIVILEETAGKSELFLFASFMITKRDLNSRQTQGRAVLYRDLGCDFPQIRSQMDFAVAVFPLSSAH